MLIQEAYQPASRIGMRKVHPGAEENHCTLRYLRCISITGINGAISFELGDRVMSETKSGFSDAERAAMKQRAEELKAMKGVKGSAKTAKEYQACLDAIESLDGTDRVIAERLHAIVSDVAPDLQAKTWYGFPTYHRGGENIVFYQPASKFGTRYGTVNFDEHANLDDGAMWPVSFAVAEMNDRVEQRLRELVSAAASS